MRNRHLEERRQLLEQTEEFGMSEMESELQKLEDDLDANQEDELFCVACNKELRNEKAFAAHRNQKKHLENVKKLKDAMMEEDLLNSDDLKDSDHSEPEVEQLDEQVHEEIKVTEMVEDLAKTSKSKSKKKRKNKESGKFNTTTSTIGELQCAVCEGEFKSKNKLFNHLKETGHAVAKK